MAPMKSIQMAAGSPRLTLWAPTQHPQSDSRPILPAHMIPGAPCDTVPITALPPRAPTAHRNRPFTGPMRMRTCAGVSHAPPRSISVTRLGAQSVWSSCRGTTVRRQSPSSSPLWPARRCPRRSQRLSTGPQSPSPTHHRADACSQTCPQPGGKGRSQSRGPPRRPGTPTR